MVSTYLTSERGASAAEYALVLAAIAGVISVALTTLGQNNANLLANVANTIGSSGSPSA